MKNKICTALLFVTLILPAFSLPEEEVSNADTEQIVAEEIAQEDVTNQEQQEEILPAVSDENISTLYKEPISKRKIAKKFLLAMFGVFMSSLVIYVGLSMYNKIREGAIADSSIQEEEAQLSAPHDFTDAIKSFLNNTKWD